jgi:hypothetical protein
MAHDSARKEAASSGPGAVVALWRVGRIHEGGIAWQAFGTPFTIRASKFLEPLMPQSMSRLCLSCGAPAVTPEICANCKNLHEEYDYYRRHSRLLSTPERVLAWHDTIRGEGGSPQDSHKVLWRVALKIIEHGK